MTTQARCIDVLGVALALLGPATMAIAAAPSAPAQVQAVSASVAVKRGDTLDQLIARHLAHIPLRQDLLRQALIKKNPAAFKGGKAEGLLAGATLQLPVLADFRYLFATASDAPPVTPAELEPTPPAVDPRKGWVRFP